MSVVFMLAILWWGLVGFAGFMLGVFAFYHGVREKFGLKGLHLALSITAAVILGLYLRSFGQYERAANEFLDSWQAASNGFPDGAINTTEISAYIDCDRSSVYNPYLPDWYRIVHKSRVRDVGDKTVLFGGSPSTKAKVFSSSTTMVIRDERVRMEVRLWIAKDNCRVVRLVIAGIDIGDALSKGTDISSDEFMEQIKKGKL